MTSNSYSRDGRTYDKEGKLNLQESDDDIDELMDELN